MVINQNVLDAIKAALESISKETENECAWIITETVDDAKVIARYIAHNGYSIIAELGMQRDGWLDTSVTDCVTKYSGRKVGTRKILMRSRRQYDEKIKNGGVRAGPVFRIDKYGNLLKSSNVDPWMPWFMKEEENTNLEKYFDEIMNDPKTDATQGVADF